MTILRISIEAIFILILFNFIESNFCIQDVTEPGTITVSLLVCNNEFRFTMEVKQTTVMYPASKNFHCVKYRNFT